MAERTLYPLIDALAEFVNASQTQSQEHIRPLHWYIAAALVVEGGFPPEHITPTPPFRIERRAGRHILIHDESAARPGERTILGGLKTKNVDVVVATSDVGPCLAVSVKGSLNAFRNLTNRMEEAVGDCTNLHISYPTLVYGFLHVIRATPEKDARTPNDVAVRGDGMVVDSIVRYHDALSRLTGRSDVRNEVSRYESVSLIMADTDVARCGSVRPDYPIAATPLRFERFFEVLYRTYDMRFVYSAPPLKRVTERLEWAADSPAFQNPELQAFVPRIAAVD